MYLVHTVLNDFIAIGALSTQHSCFYEFKSHVNTMVNNMDVIAEHFQRKLQESEIFEVALFRANTTLVICF